MSEPEVERPDDEDGQPAADEDVVATDQSDDCEA